MKPPRPQFTLAELMGLVAVCALAFAMLMTPAALFGAGVLVVLPGFVIDRVRGGNGIGGGILSGCLIPTVLASIGIAIAYLSGSQSVAQTRDSIPALYLIFVIGLIWSSLASILFYLLDRALQGRPRSSRRNFRADDPGIRFLEEDGPSARAGIIWEGESPS